MNVRRTLSMAAVFFAAAVYPVAASDGNPQLQQQLAEVKQAAAANKQALAGYTWQERQTVSVKGEPKKEEVYNVRLGPDGRPEKILVSGSPAPQAPSGRPLRRHIMEKKTEEFEQYAKEVGALAQSYRIDPSKLQQAFARGDLQLGSAGAPGELEIAVTNYNKPNDSVRIFFNRDARAIERVDVASYLNEPNDAVTMQILFGKLPDGTNHVLETTINGVSKQLTIQDQNYGYVRQ